MTLCLSIAETHLDLFDFVKKSDKKRLRKKIDAMVKEKQKEDATATGTLSFWFKYKSFLGMGKNYRLTFLITLHSFSCHKNARCEKKEG